MTKKLAVPLAILLAALVAGTILVLAPPAGEPAQAKRKPQPTCSERVPTARTDREAGLVLARFVRSALLRIHPECAKAYVSGRWKRAGWPKNDGIPVVFPTEYAKSLTYSQSCSGNGPCFAILASSHPSPRVYNLSLGFRAPDAIPTIFQVSVILGRGGWRVDNCYALVGNAGPAASS